MRHRKKTVKLGRDSAQREALLSGLVCDLIDARRITTTLPKAKAARSLAERMVTLGKKGDLAARRRAISMLKRKSSVGVLFEQIAPGFADRAGGYTRIYKLGPRSSDASEMAILEFVEHAPVKKEKKADKAEKPEKAEEPKEEPKAKKKPAKKKAAKKKAAKAEE